jgi:hypothetical protein
VYSATIRIIVSIEICSDGIAQPPHPARMGTPNGRGRCAIAPRMTWISLPTMLTVTRATMRWRRRFTISRATISERPTAFSTHQDASAANALNNEVAPSPASQATTASSTTVTATAVPSMPRANTAIVRIMTTMAAVSQPIPLVWRRCGSGGGSPVGRRRGAVDAAATAERNRLCEEPRSRVVESVGTSTGPSKADHQSRASSQ